MYGQYFGDSWTDYDSEFVTDDERDYSDEDQDALEACAAFDIEDNDDERDYDDTQDGPVCRCCGARLSIEDHDRNCENVTDFEPYDEEEYY